MSTRSGRRIHSSFHENTLKIESEPAPKSERKTRGKRLKENIVNFDEGILTANKKRQNYVTYPSEDIAEPAEVQTAKKTRRHTLKEHNVPAEPISSAVQVKKIPRLTRHTRKFAQNVADDGTEGRDTHTEITTESEVKDNEDKNKKIKKTKGKMGKPEEGLVKSDSAEMKPEESAEDLQEVPAKSKKTKKQKRNKGKGVRLLNQSTSVESFHSAAGSPLNEFQDINTMEQGDSQDIFVSLDYEPNPEEIPDPVDSKKFKKNKLKRQSAVKSAVENQQSPSAKGSNSTFDIQTETEILDTTFEKVSEKRLSRFPPLKTPIKSEKLNGIIDKSPKTSVAILDTTFEKNDTKLNNTFDKSEAKLNTTFDKSEAKLNTTFDKSETKINTTFDKSEAKINTTFDKSDAKINTTFDKSESKLNTTFDKSDSKKSSLISSDRDTLNMTFDKSSSLVSITDDEDKIENIVKTTPILIESSLDESQISINITKPTPENKRNSKKSSEPTPLKREGTFTKENSQLRISDHNLSTSMEKTPPKGAGFKSTPGSTPYHPTRTRSSQKERTTLLNVTRSLEKSRPSSEAPNQIRQTRVMFCSPSNTPIVESQQKRKVIKSSMKGSNKSFVFEETDVRPVAVSRKRSLTASDAGSRTKRARVEPQRPRTASALASVPTPKQCVTPCSGRASDRPAPAPARTKLPNFAALHQRRFAKMESLDECQQRKAKRAKQLLTPRAKGQTKGDKEPKSTEQKQKPVKPLTPSKTPKLQTLESLRPGFTRFGFKLQSEANPFALPNKTETKPKEIKPNGLIKPLTTGNTLKKDMNRKEMAKQTIMREKVSKGDKSRADRRTVIKGVRTNRRFDLQMQMRNLE